jgi:hypothetical protein
MFLEISSYYAFIINQKYKNVKLTDKDIDHFFKF